MSARLFACETALALLPERVLAAVSGGVDSVALLHALVRSGRRPVVLHVNHGWRPESAGEAHAVRALAKEQGLTFETTQLRGISRNEAAARAARHAFFAKIAKKQGIPDLILAHHADDQVETFLMQLLRGAGAGARGMETLSNRDGLVAHRPWLALWKREIVAYARLHRLTWSEDATNRDLRHRRNLVRRRLLPYLTRTTGPHAAPHLWQAAEIARAEGAWLDELCREAATGATLSVAALRRAPLAEQRRTVLRWLQGKKMADIDFAVVEAVRGLLHRETPAKINLARGRFARRRAGSIFIE